LLCSTPLLAQNQGTEDQFVHPEHGDLSEIGAKLSNPVSNVWALFTEFDLNFSNGDLNQGDAKPGSRMLFQPVLPIPLFGEGDEQWKLITRPSVPILFSQPVPDGFDKFNYRGGLGDIQLPMLITPPTGNLLFGVGATGLFDSATVDDFGRDQWEGGSSSGWSTRS
jgi:hypothetical protein